MRTIKITNRPSLNDVTLIHARITYTLNLLQQDTVGHEFDLRLLRDVSLETDQVRDFPFGEVHLLGYALAHRHRRHSARFGYANQFLSGVSSFVQKLRHLRSLSYEVCERLSKVFSGMKERLLQLFVLLSFV